MPVDKETDLQLLSNRLNQRSRIALCTVECERPCALHLVEEQNRFLLLVKSNCFPKMLKKCALQCVLFLVFEKCLLTWLTRRHFIKMTENSHFEGFKGLKRPEIGFQRD